MKRFFIIVILLITTTITSACQPTPDEAVVVSGGDFEQKMSETDIPFSQYEVPETWQETVELKGGDEKIHIDADVTVPDVENVPIYSVSQSTLSADQVEKMAGHFNDEFFYVHELTKSEIEERLINLKRLNDEEMAKYYEEMLPGAPETVIIEEITDFAPQEHVFGGYASADDGTYYMLTVAEDLISVGNGATMDNSILKLNNMKPVEDLSLSKEEAVIVATQELEHLGYDMLAVVVEEGALFQFSDYYASHDREGERKEGYFIKFALNVDGFAGVLDNGYSVSPKYDDVQYSAPFYPQEAHIFVDDTGSVLSLQLLNPVDLGEKVIQNAGLMSFKDVQERIREMLVFKHSLENALPVYVTDVSLRMSIATIKDYSDSAIYIPTWIVEYYVDLGDSFHSYEYLAINAIDGGRVIEVPI